MAGGLRDAFPHVVSGAGKAVGGRYRERVFRCAIGGYPIFMSDFTSERAAGAAPADVRIEERAADLLPEERVAGSADAEAQARAILAESDEREADVEAAPDSFLEHRRSDQTAAPDETTR
jgi:hypothetical protein